MVNFCAMIGCGNRGDRDKDKRFYRLPAVVNHQGEQTRELSQKRRDTWVARIRRQDIKPKNYPYTRVCSDHFVSGMPSSLYDTLNEDWAPSKNLGYRDDHTISKDAMERQTRASERAARKRNREEMEMLNEGNNIEIEDNSSSSGETNTAAVETQTTLSQNDIVIMEEEVRGMRAQLAHSISKDDVEKKVHDLEQKIEGLTGKLKKHSLDEAAFENDDNKVRYYTGLSTWKLLMVLFGYVQSYLKQRSNLTPFQQLLLTLMKLRLNLPGQDLAYRFHVHGSTVTRTFQHVISVLYVRLKPLIIWPDRDVLLKTMPVDFRKHCPRCVVIIDCFEIFLERPTNLLARAQTYSSYKHHNTVKYLIGVTPQGTVSYISNGWGGRTSDKCITEECGLLNKLIPGDTILADRGFDIKDTIGFYCATITMPAFTKGKAQLSGIDVEQTRRIANIRIHVERVIGNIRQKFSMLSSTIPIDFVSSNETVPTLDKVVCVACALINLCDSVVPFD